MRKETSWREREGVCVCVCVCVCERERERKRGREGGETSTHHSVTKLGGISELMDGERKPNVKF
jgi:hypothetical protein